MNARDWVGGIGISVEDWVGILEAVELVRPPKLAGYKGPARLLRDAALCWLGHKPMTTAYYEVFQRIGAANSVAEPEKAVEKPVVATTDWDDWDVALPDWEDCEPDSVETLLASMDDGGLYGVE